METLITCKRCQSRVPVSELRSNSAGAGWICYGCYAKEHNLLPVQSSAKPALRTNAVISYLCDSCKHRFTSTFKQKLCPNCGERGSLKPAGGSGAGLIWEINEVFGF